MEGNGFSSTRSATLWETAGVKVDAAHNRLIREDSEVIVEPRVMDVLLVLMQYHGEVVSRDRLIEKVWQGRPISDEAVNRAIFEIRKAFSDIGIEAAVIRTVRSRGYEWVPNAQAHDGNGTRFGRRRGVAAGALLLGALIVASALFLRGRSVDPESAPASIPPLSLPAPSAPVIRLTKPENGLPPGERETYGVALLGRVQRLLAHQNSLVVRPANTDTEAGDAMSLALTLDTAEGSMRLAADLTSPSGGTVWADTITLPADFSRLASAPEQLVSGLMQSLGLDYRPHEPCPMPTDAAALEDYFESRRLVALRGEENLRQGIETLQAILEREPQFSQAWAVLARAWEVLPVYIDGDVGLQERARSDALSRVAATKALEICPNNALAFQIAGATPGYDGDNPWIRLEYRMRHALALNPNDGELARRYSELLFRAGKYEEAYKVRRHAYRVAPHHPRIGVELAWMEADLGNLDRAESLLASARALGSMIAWPMLEHSLASRRQDWGAIESILTQYPEYMQPAMEAVHQVERNPDDPAAADEAEAVLRRLMDEDPERGNMLAHVMGIAIGRLDLAFEAYDVMRRDQYGYFSFWSHRNQALRQDPRFAEAVFEMNLREYWERFGDPDFCRLTEEGLDCHS